MVFSSIIFLFFFLPLTIILYFLAPRRGRNAVLFLVSIFFYAWGEPVYVLLMLFSILVNYLYGRCFLLLSHPGRKRILLTTVIFINLGLLGFFKYGDFALQNINSLLGTQLPLLHLPLPIGISFYTFQTLSYVIDVYRDRCPVQKNLIDFGCYTAMFSQLIAGPIVRYISISEQLRFRKETPEKFTSGIRLFTIGLSKKVLLANNMGLLWNEVSGSPTAELSALTAWLGILAFAFQIYFDFSGYSDMAVGLGRMFGFDFPTNFRYPYIARSITDFWRRWHMTLSAWFQEYVYISLGGNRVKAVKNIRNLVIVWALTGIWHGASWNFLFWGFYYALLLILEKYIWRNMLTRLPAAVSHCYTLLIVLIGWVFFSFDSLRDGLTYLKVMWGGGAGFADLFSLYVISSYGLIFILCGLGSTPWPKNLWEKFALRRSKSSFLCSTLLCLAALFCCLAYIVDSSYNPFLYFRF